MLLVVSLHGSLAIFLDLVDSCLLDHGHDAQLGKLPARFNWISSRYYLCNVSGIRDARQDEGSRYE